MSGTVSRGSFEGFSYIVLDIEYQSNALFTQSLLRVYVNSLASIITNLKIIDDDDFPLPNDIRDSLVLENWTNCHYN